MHSCPECGLDCYCGGDIDDLQFDDSQQALICTCCVSRDDEDDFNQEDDYDDFDANREI